MPSSTIRKDPKGGVEKVNTRRYSKEEELILARLIRQNASSLGLFDDQIKSIGKKMIKYKVLSSLEEMICRKAMLPYSKNS